MRKELFFVPRFDKKLNENIGVSTINHSVLDKFYAIQMKYLDREQSENSDKQITNSYFNEISKANHLINTNDYVINMVDQ